ncbi:MAG: cytochrome c [Gammaproteobacteria bacterium]|jgi:cytochrome c556|nr:cytochrome c [Gammaproteobacteria bacterium]
MSKSKSIRLSVVALVGTLAAGAVFAQDARVAQQIKYRQGAYTVLGAQFGMMGAMASGKAPFDANAFRVAAERAAFMSTVVPDVFPAGSDVGNTKAKADIWKNQAEFQKLMTDLRDKTAALSAAAKTANNVDAVKAAFGAAGQACKACHDKYKAD